MDSVNLSENRGTPLSKSNSSINGPTGCSCCGFKDYPQNIPQAYCFAALYPGIPKCKHTPDHPPDSSAVPHPLFSSFPFQQHFFPNAIVPLNFCSSEKVLSEERQTNGLQQSKSETVHHPAEHYVLHKKGKRDYGDSKATAEEGAKENNHILRPETSLPYSHSVESQFNSTYQKCVCGDPYPLACSPLIMPVFSYCFLWNTPTLGPNLLHKNYNSYLTENFCPKSSESLRNKKYSCGNESKDKLNEVKETETFKARVDINPDSTESVQDAQKECEAVNESSKAELETEEEIQENLNLGISTGMSQDEINLGEESCSKSTHEDMNESVKNESDEEEEEDQSEAETEVKSQAGTEESFKQDERDSLNEDDLTSDIIENSTKESECHAAFDASLSIDLQTPAKSSACSLDDTSENQENISGEMADNLPTNASNDEAEEKNSEDETVAPNNKEGTVCKKYIKNFTVTGDISDYLSREVQRLAAAAGDLGGETCKGYKVKISALEENEPEKPPKEELESEKSFPKGVQEEEEETKSVSDKNSEENKNSGHKYKSGIAKFLNNSNSKILKTSALKNAKNCKNDSNQKEKFTKHKHACYPLDVKNPTIEPIKIQKPKKSTKIQLQASVSGLETEEKLCNKKQRVRKDKSSHKTDRPCNVQKAVKSSVKQF